jgi:hypothetical protein
MAWTWDQVQDGDEVVFYIPNEGTATGRVWRTHHNLGLVVLDDDNLVDTKFTKLIDVIRPAPTAENPAAPTVKGD